MLNTCLTQTKLPLRHIYISSITIAVVVLFFDKNIICSSVHIVITFLLISLFPFELFMSMMYLLKYLTAATNADVSFKERPLIRVAQTKNKAAQPVPHCGSFRTVEVLVNVPACEMNVGHAST
jgi:hypothetical protein